MFIKQLSVFVENKLGRVSEILEVLSENKVNIEALSISETAEYGIMRMIVSDPRLAAQKLSESGVVVKCTDVVSAVIDDTPGGLSKLLLKLKNHGIFVEYLYAFVAKKEGEARLVIKASDPEKANSLLDK